MSILTIVLLVMYMIGFILSLIFLLMSQHSFGILNNDDTKNMAIGFMTYIYLMAYNLLFNMPRIMLTLWPTMKKFFKKKKGGKNLLGRDDEVVRVLQEFIDDDDDDDGGDEDNADDDKGDRNISEQQA